jgi:hypothetical protein
VEITWDENGMEITWDENGTKYRRGFSSVLLLLRMPLIPEPLLWIRAVQYFGLDGSIKATPKIQT